MEMSHCSLMTFTLDIDVAMKKMSVEECLLLAKNEGIMMVDAMNLSENAVQEYARTAKELGMKSHCYIGRVSFFSNPEEKIRSTLRKHLESAASLGAKLLMIVPLDIMKDGKACAKLGKEHVQQRLKKYFSMAIEMAKNSGIKVCFETTPQDYTCLSGIEDCRWILEQVPGLGLVYDTANMLPHGDDPVEYYETLKRYVVHTHVKDVTLSKPGWKDRVLPGERTKDGQVMKNCVFGQGVIPLREILQRMERDGYQGIYALEYCHPEKFPANFDQNTQQMKAHTDFLQSACV